MLTEVRTLKKRQELEKEIQALDSELDRKRALKTIPCAQCGKRHKIKDIDLIAVMYYVEPYGCTGGAYWSFSEYNFFCQKKTCGIRNRFLWNSYYKLKYYDRKYHSAEKYFFREYKDLFRSLDNEYPERSSFPTFQPKFVNNYYVDQNLDRFIGKEQVDKLITHFDDQYLEITKKLKT